MSVIFEALQKLRGASREDIQDEEQKTKPGNVYTVADIIFSPTGLLAFGLIVLLVGFGGYYAQEYLNANKKGNPVLAASSMQVNPGHQTGVTTTGATKEAGTPKDIPPPPSGVKYERAVPGKLYLPPNTSAVNKDKQDMAQGMADKAPFHDTSANTRAGIIPCRDEDETKASYHSPVANYAGKPESSYEKHEPDVSGNGEHYLNKSIQTFSNSGNKVAQHMGVTKEPNPVSPEVASNYVSPFNKPLLHRQVSLHREGGEKNDDKDRPVEAKKNLLTKARTNKEKVQKKEEESWQKTVRISRLVTAIQVAMAQGDEEKVNRLLPELSMIKGKDNTFVLKLKAFWMIKKQRFDLAKELLTKVLARKPEDLEAGLNMAIVEIKTGKLKEARERLKALQAKYFDHPEISDLLGKISG